MNIYQRIAYHLFEQIQVGRLTLLFQNDDARIFNSGGEGIDVCIHIHDLGFFKKLILQGEMGLCESYSDGLWDAAALTPFIELLIMS